MARKVGQIIRRGARTWLVRVYDVRDAAPPSVRTAPRASPWLGYLFSKSAACNVGHNAFGEFLVLG